MKIKESSMFKRDLKKLIKKHYQAAYNYLVSGHSYRETADNFGISKNTVYRIKQQTEN